MNNILENYSKNYSEQIKKRRFWNIFIVLGLFVAILISSSIIDLNITRIASGIPRLGDYIAKILPNLDTNLLFSNSQIEGSVPYWYFNFKKYIVLLYETFNMAVLSTL